MSSRHFTADIKDAAIADYKTSGDHYKIVAARHGVSRGALHAWVNPDGVPRKKAKTWGADEIALTGGRWVICQRTRVQRWVKW